MAKRHMGSLAAGCSFSDSFDALFVLTWFELDQKRMRSGRVAMDCVRMRLGTPASAASWGSRRAVEPTRVV